jgi:aspartyl-tRNA(Asn)/glutamyl-tRNA(Gln) amidotransferase subunit A
MTLAAHAWTARELAKRVAAREVSAVEVARFFVDRVEHLNPALNAIVQFDPQHVLQEAATVDRRLANGDLLPLAGVSITVKDNLWVEGRRVAQGSKLFADFVAPCDAWAVARLRQLGPVVLGITNCSEFACKGVTSNLLYGTTVHPMDARLNAGRDRPAARRRRLPLGSDCWRWAPTPAARCTARLRTADWSG